MVFHYDVDGALIVTRLFASGITVTTKRHRGTTLTYDEYQEMDRVLRGFVDWSTQPRPTADKGEEG